MHPIEKARYQMLLSLQGPDKTEVARRKKLLHSKKRTPKKPKK